VRATTSFRLSLQFENDLNDLPPTCFRISRSGLRGIIKLGIQHRQMSSGYGAGGTPFLIA
jgi:hypothetical protein